MVIHQNPSSDWDDYNPPKYPPAGPFPQATRHRMKARRVVLAAGSLGSTYLLLRSREALRLDHPALGRRFCGNGDILGLVRDAVGNLESTNGPVITAYRRFPADTDTGDPNDHGMYIEDAGYPAFAAWLAQLGGFWAMGKGALRHWFRWQWRKWRRRRDTNLSAEVNDVLADGAFSARFMPILGMGRDTPDGRLFLDENNPKVLHSDWTVQTSRMYINKMEDRMRDIAEGLGGRYASNPLFKRWSRLITVHPVGGCPTDTDHFEGVIDTFGRVRGVPGLRVCDGSVFPGPIGPNPSLTIAAFARRSALNLLEENNFEQPPLPADDYS
jgi:cholesterol oxidase